MILITLQPKLDSRSETLLKTLNNNNKCHLIISKRNLILFRFFEVIITLFKILFISFIKDRNVKAIYFMFNSHLIYPFATIFSYFNFTKIVVDLGYSIMEHSSYEKQLIKKFYFSIEKTILTKKRINILLESRQQVDKFRIKYQKPNFFTFYMLQSKGINNRKDFRYNLLSDKEKFYHKNLNTTYLLFRGRLNKESGIENIIKQYNFYTEAKKNQKIFKLIIQGWGEKSKDINQLLNALQNKHIIYISDFISSQLLIELIKNSSGIIGQFNNYENRLDYTIPNKYFEALYFNKLYITPIWEPLKKSYLNRLRDIVPLINNEQTFGEWLLLNSDHISKLDIEKEKIKKLSELCLKEYNENNKKVSKFLS